MGAYSGEKSVASTIRLTFRAHQPRLDAVESRNPPKGHNSKHPMKETNTNRGQGRKQTEIGRIGRLSGMKVALPSGSTAVWALAWTICCFMVALGPLGPPTAALAAGPVVDYTFEDISNGFVHDSSGNSLDGIVHGNLSQERGVVGEAARFNGDGYIEIPKSKRGRSYLLTLFVCFALRS